MAKKGAIFSEEHRQKLKESHLGKIPWNKGKTGIYSEETRLNMSKNGSIARMGHITSDETKKKISEKNKNRVFGPLSQEHKNNISKASKGIKRPHPKRKSTKGIPTGIIPKSAFKQGQRPWNYIDGMCNRKDAKNRYGKDWPKIRTTIFERDGYCCQKCGNDGILLEAHHIIPFMITKDNSFENLISLCKSCHRKVEAIEMRKLKGMEVA